MNIAGQAEYRFSFLFQLFAMVFNDSALLVIWALFFKSFPSVQGWTFEDMVLLLAIQWAGTTLMFLLGGGIVSLSELISTGGLDYYLTLPGHPLWNISLSYFYLPDVATLATAIAAWVWALGFSLGSFGFFIFLSLCSAIIFFNFYLILGSLSFYFGNADYFVDLMSSAFHNIAFFPQTVFPRWMKLITTFIIPVFFMATLPISLARHFEWHSFCMLLGGVVGSTLISLTLFNRGLRHYESGSALQMKM